MRSKTISYRRKNDITSRKGKEERKNREEHTVTAMPVTIGQIERAAMYWQIILN
jgi:hypothetical protein